MNEASGGCFFGSGDVNDLHSYPEPGVRAPTPHQTLAVGEFGGIGYKVPGHTWFDSGNTYTNMSTPIDLLYLYAEYAYKLKQLHD